jgi:hypothetical protein
MQEELMNKGFGRIKYKFLLMSLILLLVFQGQVFASTTNESIVKDEDELRYYFSSLVNAGKDTGYSETNKIDNKDPHYGWKLGRFYIDGFTRISEDSAGNPIFLKNVGDTVTLWFNLEQDIDKLNDNEDLSISKDENGYDEYFGIEKTDFGRGTLIVRYTDYKNESSEPVIYTNFLSSKVVMGADTEVRLFEEGDYEVSLNYEIKDSPRKVFGKDIIPKYTNYRIFFKFSVRNGNAMAFPFDIETKSELTNSSFTENGFYIDFAKSRYLDINIKREIVKEESNTVEEDTRFNRPAKDGEEYTDEGIYTISVKNRYTDQETVKKIYVGTNNIIKAYLTTGIPINEIEEMVSKGAEINDDGSIINVESVINEINNDDSIKEDNITIDNLGDYKKYIPFILAGLLLIFFIILKIVLNNRKNTYKKNKDISSEREESEK